MRKHFILLTLLLTILTLPVLSQETIQFENIRVKDGLSSPKVNQVIEDDKGFIWIATFNGLNRYDGVEFKVFKHDDDDPYSLTDNNIRCLYKDRKGDIWVGTLNSGLNKYDYKTGKFTHYLQDTTNASSISSNEILTIFEDSENRIWVGTENGLNLFNEATNTFTSFLANENNPNALQGSAVLSIIEDHRGWLWVGTWNGGLHLVIPDNTPEGFSFRAFKQGNRSTDLQSSHIWTMLLDQEKRLCIGTFNGGLSVMLPNEETDPRQFQPTFQTFKSKADVDNSALNNNLVFALNQDKKGQIWIGTVNGISVFALNTVEVDGKTSYETGISKYFRNDFLDQQSLINNDISNIFVDKNGVVWCSTVGGISKYDSRNFQFTHYIDYQPLLKNISITDLIEFDENTVYIGSRPDLGLIEYNPKTNAINNYYFGIDKIKPYNAKTEFVSFYKSDEETLWVGSRSGLLLFNTKTKTFKQYQPYNEKGELLSSVHILDIYPVDDDQLWLATDVGIANFNIKDETFKFLTKDSKGKTLTNYDINELVFDDKGNMWLATYGGLSKVTFKDDGSFLFKNYLNDLNDPKSICSNRVFNLLFFKNKLWIGTENGLSIYQESTDDFQNITSKDGLKDSDILAVLGSDDGKVWMTTRQTLIRINPDNNEITQFNEKDGIKVGNFWNSSYFKNADGKLFFGGNNGYIAFYSKDIKTNEYVPPVYISDIKIFNKSRYWDKNVPILEEIKLNYKENYLTIDFTALNFSQASDNQYAYKLEGFNDDWVYCGNQKSVSFSNLKGGTYTFRVKGSNNDNIWNEKGTALKIIVRPPFWDTTLFKILMVSAIVSFFFWILYSRNQQAKQKRRELETQVSERTGELASEKEKVEQLLTQIKKKNEQLIEQSDALELSNKDLKRSNVELEQLAFVASHDMQEPLRMVGNFVQLLEEDYEDKIDDEGRMYISYIVDGVKRMSSLIDDLLQFSRVGRKALKAQPVKTKNIVDQKLFDLSMLIEERDAKVVVKELPETINCEPQQISMVFQNLINNAIKFNKSPRPEVTISSEEREKDWLFSVKDNGIGIAPKNKELVFEIFKRLHRKEEYKGTGIGLALCKRIALRHRGDIWFESELGKGATFYFTISKNLTT